VRDYYTTPVRRTGLGTSRPVSRILYRSCDRWRPSICDHRCRWPGAAYPQTRAGSPDDVCAGPPCGRSLLALLRVGFAEPTESPRSLVVSYTTVSPLPRRAGAVCFLWHFPAGHPGWALPTTPPFGVRTFLDGLPPRPPGRLVQGAGYRAAQVTAWRSRPVAEPTRRIALVSWLIRQKPPTDGQNGGAPRCMRSGGPSFHSTAAIDRAFEPSAPSWRTDR